MPYLKCVVVTCIAIPPGTDDTYPTQFYLEMNLKQALGSVHGEWDVRCGRSCKILANHNQF